MRKIKSHLSYSNVVATIALVVALTGGATAVAITASKNSVTTKAIRANAVRAKNLGPTIKRQATDPANMGTAVIANCQPGERVLSGGWSVGNTTSVGLSAPTKNGWSVTSNGPFPQSVTAFAWCLKR